MVCLKTLVVETSGAEASGLSAMLGRIGHEVCGVAGNVSGLAQLLFERATPDLIALDLNLDEGNEARGLATVLQATGPIPIVFVTGCVDWPERDGIRSIGGTALLIRPFGELELRTRSGDHQEDASVIEPPERRPILRLGEVVRR
jgi:DNA-binding response OmpR family regulator